MAEPALHIPKSFDPSHEGYDDPICGANRYAGDGPEMVEDPALSSLATCKNCLRIAAARQQKKSDE